MIVEEPKTLQSSQDIGILKNILVAVDFSEASRRALCVATKLAPRNADLCVIHISNADWRYETLEYPPELDLERSDSQERLNVLVREFAANRNIRTMLLKRASAARAVAAIAAEGTDLLVIGTRGRGGLQKLALGSFAEELLRIAPCPVMTVGPKADISDTRCEHGFQTILFATDFGKGSTKALPLVIELARQHHSRLVVMHMVPPMPATSTSLSAYAPATAAAEELEQWEGSSRMRSLQQIKEWLPRETGLETEPTYVVGTDFLPEGILTAAAEFKSDLIVMGANHTGSAKIAAHVPWTAVHEVVRKAPCPVLTVAA
jgi:nucleotide-binding universal stress UspA family protein